MFSVSTNDILTVFYIIIGIYGAFGAYMIVQMFKENK